MSDRQDTSWLDDVERGPTSVRLIFRDGRREYVDDVHIHGVEEGSLLLAAGVPGGGLRANIVRRVRLAEITGALTSSAFEDHSDGGPDFWMGSQDS